MKPTNPWSVHRHAFGWAAVALLAGSCCLLAVLQYRWINEFSGAERQRLQEQLQTGLNLLSREFNREISSAIAALIPPDSQIAGSGIAPAYAARYQSWRQSHPHTNLFRRIALAMPAEGAMQLEIFDAGSGRFQPADWPPEWGSLRDRLTSRFDPRPAGENAALLVIPRYPDQAWLLAELNIDHIRDTMLPDLMTRFVGSGKSDYDTEVVLNANPSQAVFGASFDSVPDGSAPLLDLRLPRLAHPGPPGPPRDGFHRPPPEVHGEPGPPPNDPGAALWTLLVRHHSGSLEAMVDQTRSRNLAASLGLLLLILLTVALLVRFSRQSQRLAEQQMNFVASVSHELRTPLTAIRVAAFNLRGKLAARPDQVERYGALIQDESEKLTALVEQVLRFASTEAGQVIQNREPVEVAALIDSSLQSSGAEENATVERRVDSGLPRVLADPVAMKHALQNLVENALKYGGFEPGKGKRWLGVFASSSDSGSVEIRVADHGPGIPPDEQDRIFDPFFRGRRALSDQIHGTGLGLSLVKKIIEAHGGTVRVSSEASGGTEFVVRIPAAPAEPAT